LETYKQSLIQYLQVERLTENIQWLLCKWLVYTSCSNATCVHHNYTYTLATDHYITLTGNLQSLLRNQKPRRFWSITGNENRL